MVLKRFLSDAALIAALKAEGISDAAIRFLYQEHYTLLSRYVLNNSGTNQDAEDVFQEVVVAFINLIKADRFRGESSVKTFLFSLNKNMWLNELKRRGRAMAREQKYEHENEQAEPTADLLIEMRQTKTALLQAVDDLGENCKRILLLFYFENRSMKEILQVLPYENEQVVRNKKGKCLKKLAALIAADPALSQQLQNYLHG